MKTKILSIALLAALPLLTACSDFFEQDSDHVIYADKDHLNNATDTIYSVTGIQNKLQAIADRTILLGEVRGDLVDVTSHASADLRQLSNFSADDDNIYNQPKDYYAVINNCNYFIAKADTALKNNRNEYIFQREYAAVKAYRAWTYLQLVLNYGKVPFVTKPILTKEEADATYPTADLQTICQYFIKDLEPYSNIEYPHYGTIRSTDSRFFYFPIDILLGDLNLWAGNYRQSAQYYYKYISTRNGTNSAYYTGTNNIRWIGTTSWSSISMSWLSAINSESYSNQSELITMIPCDSIPSEGNYSQLRNIFNSREENDYKVSVTPSNSLINLSESQVYTALDEDQIPVHAPSNLDEHLSGDLRLYVSWTHSNSYRVNGKQIDYQTINKYDSRNVHIYRKQMVYLRMAEALNRAGFPRFAYHILAGGVNNRVLQQEVIPYYRNDSAFIASFDFPNSQYILATPTSTGVENTEGIHDRGSGWSTYNAYYLMPTTDDADSLNYQIEKVEDMIMNEEGLEFAFEGHRFYDLMRIALRRNDPAYLADRIYARDGIVNTTTVKSEITKDLYNPNNWYLSWNGKIGIMLQ